MPFDFSRGASSLDTFYGFKSSNHRLTQLQQVLGLRAKEAEFKIVVDELEALTSKHVDIDKAGLAHNQPKALELIEEELLKLHPNLWGEGLSDKKIYFALRAVMAIHVRRKKEQSGNIYSMPKKRKHPAMAASHSDGLSDSGDEEYRPDDVPHGNRNEYHISRDTYTPNKCRRNTKSVRLSAGPSKKRPAKRDDSSSLSEAESSDLIPPPKKPKRVAPSPSINEQNPIVKTQEKPLDLNSTEIAFLHDFLSACKSSMANHLGLFLNFGRLSS